MASLLPLLLSCFLIHQQISTATVNAASNVHIVYMGENHQEDPNIVAYSHHDMLTTLLGSKEAARDSIVYSYKHGFDGFAAKLTESQARLISDGESRDHRLVRILLVISRLVRNLDGGLYSVGVNAGRDRGVLNPEVSGLGRDRGVLVVLKPLLDILNRWRFFDAAEGPRVEVVSDQRLGNAFPVGGGGASFAIDCSNPSELFASFSPCGLAVPESGNRLLGPVGSAGVVAGLELAPTGVLGEATCRGQTAGGTGSLMSDLAVDWSWRWTGLFCFWYEEVDRPIYTPFGSNFARPESV